MRWFNGLKADSVDSYRQLTQAFGSCFVTNSSASRPSMDGRYWEMYNEMDGNFDGIAINTFKNSLLAEHDFRKSLTGKLATSVGQLMDRIDKYKRVEENQMQGKGKKKVIPQERRDFRSD